MLQKVTRAVFAEALGSTFKLSREGEPALGLDLIEATDLKGRSSDPGRNDPFSLVFRGPKEPVLPQKIYQMDHDKIGKMDIFIVPIGPDDKGMLYQAVFN